MRAATLALVVATGCGATVGLSSGNALVAPGTERGTTGTLRLHDRGGPVSKFIARLLGAAGAASAAIGSSSSQVTTTERTECYGHSCQRVTETNLETTVTVDPEAAAAAAEAYHRLDEAIANTPYRAFPFETILEIADQRLGGDTSGWIFWYWAHDKPRRVGPTVVAFSFGLAGGALDFHDRKRSIPGGASGSFGIGTVDVPTSEHYYLGTPIRMSVFAHRNVWAYLQTDANWAAWFEDWFPTDDEADDIEANPWRIGARARWRGLEIGGELLTEGMSRHAATLSAEVGYVF